MMLKWNLPWRRFTPTRATKKSSSLKKRQPPSRTACCAWRPRWKICGKRTEREKAEATLYAASNFARDLLSVADNLGRALQALPEEERERAGEVEKNLIAGVEVTERELLNVFQRHGIRKIEAVGQKFDPNFHQAMFEIPTNEKSPGTVMQELQSGYAVGERCLRPSLVGVAKAEA